MRPESPALFPAFRSALTVQVLVLLLVGAAEHTVSELVEATGEHRRTVYREVVRLETAGVVVSRTIGGTKAYTANTSAPFYLPLRDLVTVVAGPAHVLAEELSGLAGIDFAVIFGSWAARHAGQTGAVPHDVDVLVVGEGVVRGDVYEAADRAQARLGLPVNPTIRSTSQWADPGDALSSQIRSSPTLTVVGEESADGTLAAR